MNVGELFYSEMGETYFGFNDIEVSESEYNKKLSEFGIQNDIKSNEEDIARAIGSSRGGIHFTLSVQDDT